MSNVIVDGTPLTPQQVVEVAYGRAKATSSDDVAERLGPARDLVDRTVDSDDVVYGITTGFGALASTHIGKEEGKTVQYNLIRSHATGVGPPMPDEIVRAMLLLRARTLAQGYSGVRPEIVRGLLELFNRDILPVVPSQGSVGASGDLAPFAHLALPFIGEGEVKIDGRIVPTSETDVAPVSLQTKEGLALLNGTEGMSSMGAIALDRARKLVETADIAISLTVEALMESGTNVPAGNTPATSPSWADSIG